MASLAEALNKAFEYADATPSLAESDEDLDLARALHRQAPWAKGPYDEALIELHGLGDVESPEGDQ